MELTGHTPEVFLSIVIPAYNEGERIGATLDKIRNYLASKRFIAEVIVVDDGSTDNTAGLLRAAAAHWPQLRVLVNSGNRGKGFSVRRGVLEALQDARETHRVLDASDRQADEKYDQAEDPEQDQGPSGAGRALA